MEHDRLSAALCSELLKNYMPAGEGGICKITIAGHFQLLRCLVGQLRSEDPVESKGAITRMFNNEESFC